MTRKQSSNNESALIENNSYGKGIHPSIKVNDAFCTIITSNQNQLMEEYKENMNLMNYDFNKQKRLSTTHNRSRKINEGGILFIRYRS